MTTSRMTSREAETSEAFVALASSFALGYDVVDLLDELTGRCARILDVESAGLLLADREGVMHVMAASSDLTRQLEVYQLQRDEGPCLDCYRHGEPVVAADLAEAAARWPTFVPAAQAAGFASVHALPMRLRDHVLGALGLFGTSVGALNSKDMHLGQALADVASVALVQDKAVNDKALVIEQLQTALTSRVVLEQAKGVLAQVGNLSMGDAFTVLRSYARGHGLRLTDVAQSVASRRLPAAALIERSRSSR